MSKIVKKTKIKTPAKTVRYQSREDVELAIKQIGDLQRELLRQATLQNDELAAINEKYALILNQLRDEVVPMQEAVQAWCESHRDELTQNGKTKTGSFNIGDVQWRQRPLSVDIRGVNSVLENLHILGLERFIRIKEEPNKEAMLNEPQLATTIAGITIKTGVEDFVISPFEQEVTP